MKILVDNKIPFINGVLEKYAEVVYLPAAAISNKDVIDADALCIRTRTKCNEELLKNSKVKMIASATIGFDHIDLNYCSENNIMWKNAPGCNAASVNQYICAALLRLAVDNKIDLRDKTIGIIGVGNVGTKVAETARILGMKVMLNDPPRENNEKNIRFDSLEDLIANSDFISLHTPLNKEGKYKTYHLADADFFSKMKKTAFIINSSRGSVVDNKALIYALATKEIAGAVIDVWEKEPYIDRNLLSLVDYGTPHIAGYSADGKAKGTHMSVVSLKNFLGLATDEWYPDIPIPEKTNIIATCKNKGIYELLDEIVMQTYDIKKDSFNLKKNPKEFENIRGNYYLRREFPAFKVELTNDTNNYENILRQLKFKLQESSSGGRT